MSDIQAIAHLSATGHDEGNEPAYTDRSNQKQRPIPNLR